MSAKKIIAIVGVPGAGKSEASKYFHQKNFPVIRFGGITDEGLRNQNLPLTQVHEKKFRESLREELGMEAYAIKNEPKIRQELKKSDTIVLDGLRSWEEYVYLKEKFPDLYLLAIYASPEIRHQRLHVRKERQLTIKEAINRDIAEILNLHMAPPIALADYLINNESSLEELNKKLDQFLSEEIMSQNPKPKVL